MDEVIKSGDLSKLFSLSDTVDFSIALMEMLSAKCDYDPELLNPTQRILFLCIQIENSGQADTILNFLQEDYPAYSQEVVEALKAIGATKSAYYIQEAIGLLPTNGESFFDHATEATQQRMMQLDSQFSDYPDGPMPELYRSFAVAHREDF